MSGMTPVPRPRFVLDGRGNKVLSLVIVALVIALLKPWGVIETTAPLPSQARLATASPSVAPPATPDPADLVSRTYDPLVFGDKELRPAWGLWPAGYLVSFGFAMRAEPSADPSAGPSPSTPGPEQATPVWPAGIDIPVGNHLLLIGINTPVGFSVDGIRLTRHDATGSTTDVAVEQLPSPWPTHFTVVAIDNASDSARMEFWPPGDYRLDLTIDPGPIARSIEVHVEGPAAAAPTPSVAP
jgi:hypothetical protein